MKTVRIEPRFEEWREKARALLAGRVAPEEVLWVEGGEEAALFVEETPALAASDGAMPRVSAAFLDLARTVAAHIEPQRWAVLYRVLWRMTVGGERHLLAMPTDADVRRLEQWRKAVSREIHKMHAFVRFRLVGVDEATGREQFVAWIEPVHRVLPLAAPFFHKRFAGMDWSILTPHECAHWDGHTLHFTPGVPRSAAPDEDALEGLWRTYFKSIFNPARLKVKMMQTEMPKKYWKNLPEAELISELIATSGQRVQGMLATEERPAKPAPKNAYLEKLRRLNEGETS